jgi:hypothetical protein
MATATLACPATAIIERAMSFPMEEVVARYAKKEGLSLLVAAEHEREMKR